LPILARILRNRGIVTEDQLQEAIQQQVLYGGRLGTNLYELGFITEDRLKEALARAHGVQTTTIDPREIKPEVLALVSKSLAAKKKVFPYRTTRRTLFLLMVDPQDHATVAEIGYSRGYIVKPQVIPEFRMVQLLRDHYGVDERWRFHDTRRADVAVPERVDAATATTRIDAAATRDEVVEAVLALCHSSFKRVVFFIVREPWVLGWSGTGEGMDQARAARLRVPLDSPSVFRSVAREKTLFVGRLSDEPENQRFLAALDKKPTTNAALVPITVRGRIVNLVWCDNGARGNIKADLGDLVLALQRVPRAYLRIIRQRIAETRKVVGGEGASP
jgi:hypothetical protein